MNSDATSQYPNIPGTPTFLLNGDAAREHDPIWEALEPKIRAALGA